MDLSLSVVRDALPAILSGLGVTVLAWLAGSALALGVGLLLALLRRFGNRAAAAVGAVEAVLLGTPFLVQIFLLYFGGPFVGIDLDPVEAGLAGLAIYGGAYFARIILAGFEAVPRGHVEAAVCAGLSRGQILRRIVFPEMALLVLPASVNMLVVLLKETAVLSIITVPELTMVVSGIGSANFAYAEAALVLALCYWGLTEATGLLGRALEARLQRFRLAV